jgi:hypothetical protein
MEAIGQDPDLGRVVTDRLGLGRRLANKVVGGAEDSALSAAARAAVRREQAVPLASRARRQLTDAESALSTALYDYGEACAQWIAEEIDDDAMRRAEEELDAIRLDVQRHQAAIPVLERRAGVVRDHYGHLLSR